MYIKFKYRHISISMMLVLLISFAVAQDHPCATGDKIIPIGLAGEGDLGRIHENITAAKTAGKSGDTLIFPTVVHIIHYSGFGDISDSQVADGLRVINEDFNRMNADTSVTRDYFKPFASAVGFKFILAKLDSNGDSTSGIVRFDTAATPHAEPFDSDFDNVKFMSHWPAHMYYNVWLVRSIQGGGAGYAQYPGTNFTYGGPWETWGIVVRNDQWGTIGSSNADGRTGTHEVGHTFGLYHTFLSGSANCGSVCDTTGDEVCDTPPAKDVNSSCNVTDNFCSNDTSGSSPFASDSVDQIENYMSYNSCQNMFSEGQRTRMRGFIAAFDTLQGLSSDANLIATGLLPPLSVPDIDGEGRMAFTIYPNPGAGRYTLKINPVVNEPIQVTVCNVLGQEILQLHELENHGYAKYALDLSAYPSGLYGVTLVTKGGVSSRKVLKE
ncbi:MAG TPA: T9SS type A sorting domain-containing protein [Flavobacteriales bacterium]|nr:T9SS type A sorting domain-containing protein [Flavobacteriales bacterium]